MHEPEVLRLLLLGGGGCGEGVGCKAGTGPGFKVFLFHLQIIMKFKIYFKQDKGTLSFCRRSHLYVAGIVAVMNHE